jgi:hypothetical protein
MVPIFIIPIAAPEQEQERGATSNVPSEEPGHGAPDLSSAAERELDVQNQGEHGDGETVAERPLDTPVEHVPEGYRVGEGAHAVVQPERSISEC